METQNIIIGVILAIVLIGGGIYINGFKNWLVWAVTEAETLFGSKTGKLKLRYAYELAVKRFPTIAKLIPFTVFCNMVDEALDIMRDMIENNKNIADAIADEIKEELTNIE
jgi:hypothetical protein